ncbi:MAG: hypothetical protein QM346_20335 [Chloroflexota bacterium]|nr:hypothetical protein [Chloroflexota bacterium]
MPGAPKRNRMQRLDAGKLAVAFLLSLVLAGLLAAQAWSLAPPLDDACPE